MSGFNQGRRGPALYPNIANLNAIPSDPSDYNLVMQRHQDGYELEQELALFTNTQFFDLDQNIPTDTYDNTLQQQHSSTNQSYDLLGDDFHLDLGMHPNPSHSLHQSYVQGYNQQMPRTNVTSPSSSSTTGAYPNGEKRKLDSLEPSTSPPNGLEDGTRVAAEEDKRRRNTAASARFRAKKKQREEAMEKTAKQMTEKVTLLETRISKLEMENELLKNLITEKSGKEVDIADLLKRSAKSARDGSTSKKYEKAIETKQELASR